MLLKMYVVIKSKSKSHFRLNNYLVCLIFAVIVGCALTITLLSTNLYCLLSSSCYLNK